MYLNCYIENKAKEVRNNTVANTLCFNLRPRIDFFDHKTILFPDKLL